MDTDCSLPALLLLLLLLRRTDATFMLPAPKNVRIDSYNLQHKLLWDPILLEGVTYTVQYKWNSQQEDEYNTFCKNIIEPVCDFTKDITFEWLIVLRVRAERGLMHSNWTDTSEFQAATHTKLGPVNFLTVSTRAAEDTSLDVSFESPLPPSTTTAVYSMKYLLQYWRSGSAVKTELWIENTFNKLTDLQASTEYCVNVTAVMEITTVIPDLTGETSHVVCAKTPGAPGLTADKVIFISTGLIILCCIFTGFSYVFSRHYRLIKMWLYPPYNIPPDIQQYLQDPPWNGFLEESKEMHLAEEQYDHISIVESES
ncbi:interferon gamma receptor 2 [Xenopus laevis]|uniref:Interferon gamma receptor 2 n=2 Tax=Xenopus laevis TaxID=8355 RepID=A0A1L8HCJ2_XENLA|nr:interferon gamma receptor 2 [Xenopus laevis]OCT93819.1 hypothetical protein XELAEV_18011489mg [Xenopus laevis]